jgi:hypothetical protein|tara:strand:+ start:51 stop:194 length:144 start_codon:yes stop_codon:yes gene_type:complete
MLQPLIESDDDVDYQKYWEKTLAYKFFKIKNPSESWKEQLIRILNRK